MQIMADAYAAFREKTFRHFAIGNFFFQLGKQMVVVAVGWELYERTHSVMALGFIGLAQVLPVFLLTLFAGHLADNADRRKIVIAAQLGMGLATLGLFLLSYFHGPVWAMYFALLLLGSGRAFNSPANSALMPQMVSSENFANAVTWSSFHFQVATVLGPTLGGLLIALEKAAYPVYLTDFLCILIFLSLLSSVKPHPREIKRKALSLESLGAGLKYVLETRLILAAITLDLFAVLFGGAMSLLPVYAKDILHVGPKGLGFLQAAPALGAITMAFILARYGELRRCGPLLLWTVVGFGLSMIVFGLSQNLWLSAAMLYLSGMFDNISVVIRLALVQLKTPDAMRGRVSAINYVFIGASNELGGFESGLVAHLIGTVGSVVSGGIATILVVLATAWRFPELLKLDRLQESTD